MTDIELLIQERQRERAWGLKALTLHMSASHGWSQGRTKQTLTEALKEGSLASGSDLDLGPMKRRSFNPDAARRGAAAGLDLDGEVSILG